MVKSQSRRRAFSNWEKKTKLRKTANLPEKTTLIKTFPGFNGKVKLMIAAGLVFKHELDLKKEKKKS